MLAYNQEQYIAQAIEGVLAQQTSFRLELVIGEDHSADATRELCKSYAAKSPDKIKLLLNENNLGLGKNYIKTYGECTGKYIAICDGDDYWTDPLKLQKQVDFLESHPEFKIVFTNNRNIYPSGIDDVRDLSGLPGEGCFEDLVFQNYIASVTAMFRNRPLPESMKSWMRELPYGDWPTYLWILKEGGKIGVIDEVTAVYRKDFGTSTALRKSRSRIGEINLDILEKLKNEPEFSGKSDILQQAILKYKTGLMASYIKEFKFFKSLKLFVYLFPRVNLIHLIKIYIYSIKRSLSNA